MSKTTYIWSVSLLIATLYLCFGLPLIFTIGLGELTPWGVAFGVVLGITPVLGLVASNANSAALRITLALVVAIVNVVSALLMLAGSFMVFSYSTPSGTGEIFSAAMILVAVTAFVINTIMSARILKNVSIMESETA